MSKEMTDRLRHTGCRLTPPRLAVLRVMEESHEHLSHSEILERGQAIYPALGRATVYRTLELLTSLGIVRPIYLDAAQSVCFTRADGAHHHLICSACRQVVEFDECVIDELQEVLSRRLNFEIRGHLLEFYGLCDRCHGGS